jgi:uncharacterized protein (TIGR02145 family)
LKVTGNNYNYSTKLISQNNLPSNAGIEYVSSVKNTTGNKPKSASAMIDMYYSVGDQLLYKGISGKYSTIIADVPTHSKPITFNFIACTDNDNNNYTIVEIGTQAWMAQNLNVGIRINGDLDQTNNSIIEKYCYDDQNNNCVTYGGLYEWDEMMQYVTTEGAKGICPTGWHIPKDAEWTVLTTFLGFESVAGGKLKETGTTHWQSPNEAATNESGFTALPGASRSFDGTFSNIGYDGYWWSSSEFDPGNTWYRYMSYFYAFVLRNNYN